MARKKKKQNSEVEQMIDSNSTPVNNGESDSREEVSFLAEEAASAALSFDEPSEEEISEVSDEVAEILLDDNAEAEIELGSVDNNSDDDIVAELESAADQLDEDVLPVEAKSDDELGELAQFDSAEIESKEFVEYDQMISVMEGLLFASDRPVSLDAIKQVFKGTNIKSKDIKKGLEALMSQYAAPERGVTLEEIGGGYQLRTKLDNIEFMKRHIKGRQFKLSGPALEVLSIVAYKQPTIKSEVDEIRGVESGHLMRALMDRGLIKFAGKSELPGKPMFYETTRKFLEIFGLRNIKELPSLGEIDELLPEGITEVEEKKPKLSDLTSDLSLQAADTYSEGEVELNKISEQLQQIDTTTEFFEQEKQRQKRREEEERARDIRESLMVGQAVEEKDIRWLARFDKKLEEEKMAAERAAMAVVTDQIVTDDTENVSVDQSANDIPEVEDNSHEGSVGTEPAVVEFNPMEAAMIEAFEGDGGIEVDSSSVVVETQLNVESTPTEDMSSEPLAIDESDTEAQV